VKKDTRERNIDRRRERKRDGQRKDKERHCHIYEFRETYKKLGLGTVLVGGKQTNKHTHTHTHTHTKKQVNI
jgi:hypothetical protein